jgi:hypothetical protein
VRFVHSFDLGPHVIRAIARNAEGHADTTPAVYRFRVKQFG